MSNTEQYDVCVVGGGPGGSTAATFVAMCGHRVLLVEKEALPVYKIGESLLPSTIHGVCSMLGVSEEIKRQNFIRKLGGTFRWGKNKEPWTFAFAESERFQGPTSNAYQVERIKFDAILLNNAKRKGVEVRERHAVQDAVFDEGRVCGIRLVDDSGREKLIRSKYVIDASGHASKIARHAGERIYSKFFRNIAVFTYFKNGGRLPAPNAGNIFCAAFEKGWFWYIPLSETLTSVGAVIGEEHSSLFHRGHEAAFNELIASCEPIQNLLRHATRSTDAPYDQIRIRKDYSYCHTSFWIPGLVLIGDAACFIDPVFSSGVHLATYSALLAARSVNTRLANGLSDEVVFKEFEARYRREYTYFYDFLTAFYDLDQDLQSYYWTARRVTSCEEQGSCAFLNLVGGDASGELLGMSKTATAKRVLDADRIFPQAAGVSTDLKSGGESTERRQFWSQLTAEGFQMQLRGVLKNSTPPERPLFKNGLVPSLDGLHWAQPAMSSPASVTVSRVCTTSR